MWRGEGGGKGVESEGGGGMGRVGRKGDGRRGWEGDGKRGEKMGRLGRWGRLRKRGY